MRTGHWSEQLYTLWWRDAGTGRARVSFGENPDALLRRLARIWHPDLDPALYDPRGRRVALADEVLESDDHDETPAAPVAPTPAPAATIVETVTVPVRPTSAAPKAMPTANGRQLPAAPAPDAAPKKPRAKKTPAPAAPTPAAPAPPTV